MTDLAFKPAVELAAALRNREISARELLEHYLDRIERYNPQLNAIVHLDADRARARADAADAALARGELWGPLHGLPITIKELFETEGFRWTAGDPQFAERVGQLNAPSTQRLLDAGAIVMGVTNSPLNGMDVQTFNEVYGTTNNPWNLDRSCGGSSGGAAAALAAGLAALEVGSDIGGSIRNPSHYCGTYGHKPTYGIVPRRRAAPPGFMGVGDLTVVGPMARSAADLDMELALLVGAERDQAIAWRIALPPPRRASLAAYRVAAWLDDPHLPVDNAVQARLQAAVAALRQAGVEVDETARPAIGELREADRIYRSLLAATTARAPAPLAGETAAEAFARLAEREDALEPETPTGGPSVQHNAAVRHRTWLELNEKRHQMRYRWGEFFRQFDVLLLPVTQVTAIPHDHRPANERHILVNGAERPYFDQLGWVGFITMAYLPATVAPIGCAANGLPVGIQIVGPYLEDRTPIDFAARLANVVGGFEAPPGFA
ncbi:MAG TPA: amidase [Dehalococcoidia bacterium]|jgi:amidase|nr:amidase [Dehalococcoidia bacterium]